MRVPPAAHLSGPYRLSTALHFLTPDLKAGRSNSVEFRHGPSHRIIYLRLRWMLVSCCPWNKIRTPKTVGGRMPPFRHGIGT